MRRTVSSLTMALLVLGGLVEPVGLAAQTVHARQTYEHADIRFGHRYADILDTSDDGRLRIDYGRFHDTVEG